MSHDKNLSYAQGESAAHGRSGLGIARVWAEREPPTRPVGGC